jgi:hypothetical protein
MGEPAYRNGDGLNSNSSEKSRAGLKWRVTRGAVQLAGLAASFVSGVSTLHIMRDCDSPRRATTLMLRHPGLQFTQLRLRLKRMHSTHAPLANGVLA